jgi:hypothetical protein
MPVSSLAGTILLIIMGVLLLFLIVQSVRGIPLKRLLSGMLKLLWKILLAAAVLAMVLVLLPRSQTTAASESTPAPRPLARAPLGPVPPVLIWIVGAVFGSVVLFMGIRIIVARRASATGSLVWEVKMARRALLNGHDLRTVILQCYQRMSQALQQEQNIERESFMTTGEFEKLLTARGIPDGPVHQLTGLFDAVRYSRWEPAAGDEQAAIGCLDAILLYSRGIGREV